MFIKKMVIKTLRIENLLVMHVGRPNLKCKQTSVTISDVQTTFVNFSKVYHIFQIPVSFSYNMVYAMKDFQKHIKKRNFTMKCCKGQSNLLLIQENLAIMIDIKIQGIIPLLKKLFFRSSQHYSGIRLLRKKLH